MKNKVLSIIISSMVTILLFAGCENINNKSSQNDINTENHNEINDTELVIEVEVNEADVPKVTNYSNNTKESSENSTSETVRFESIEGIYIGQIDNMSVEIKELSSGDVAAYIFGEHLRNYIENNLSRGNTVIYSYYENSNTKKVITEIQKKYYSYSYDSGKYVGQIDGNSIEIINIDANKKIACRIADRVKYAVENQLMNNETIQYKYYLNKDDQRVVVYIEGKAIREYINTSNELKVKYIGLADGTSIEIQYLDTGKYEGFRLDEETMKTILTIKDGSEITIQYYINDLNQKVITSIN